MYIFYTRKFSYHNILFICLISIFLGCSLPIFSQISEGGTPPSFEYPSALRSAPSTTNVPIDFYLKDIRETDSWQARAGVPMPVSKLIPVDYSIDNSGYHAILPGGEYIWRLQLKAKDAVAIMLYYTDFYIPEGGRLFIYSTDKTQVLGAYTHQTHPSGGRFATEFIGGDELVLEYAASTTSDEKPRIAISEIGYGYNTAALKAFCNITTYAAGSCEVNINCEEGEAWQNEKKGICHSVQKIGSKAYICSGSLLNNTAEDFKPFILTASHCGYNGDSIATPADMDLWMFYFHREREGCSNTSVGKLAKTLTGCKKMADTGMEGGSDGLLLLLNDTIPDAYDVYYNGWDCTGEVATSGVCIHHPQGDYQKISTYNETVQSYTFMSSDFTGDSNGHWNATFKSTRNGHGVTEGGSSGSPLFNENKLVVGALSGGSSSCSNQLGLNLYGKFFYHWDKYKANSSTRMDVWLDPLNSGVKILPGRYRKTLKPAPANFHAVFLGQQVSLSWNEPQSSEKPIYYNVYRNNMKLDETTLLSYLDNNIIFGSIVYAVSAVYEDGEESAFVSMALSIIKYKAPSDLKAIRPSDESDQVELSWTAPLYEQTIYWGTLTPVFMIGFDEKFPFYYGQKWSADEIAPLHLKTITAVQFCPIKNNTYEIYITQGAHSYRQPVEESELKPSSLNTVNLNVPFVIDGSNPLIVSILVLNIGSDYPAVCDDGPVVNGKGNLCALYYPDGDIEWEQLNDNEEPDEYDYNFIIAAVVTSEVGELLQTAESVLTKSNTVKRMMQNFHLLKASIALTDNEVSARNAVPAAFPEITKYRIYKSGSMYMHVDAPATTYADFHFTNNDYYEVSALYDMIETDKTEKTYITVVGNNDFPVSTIQIFPTVFKDHVWLRGSELISRIEILSITGKIGLVINHPERQIDTSSLAPGLYFFRVMDIHNRQTVIKAIKTM